MSQIQVTNVSISLIDSNENFQSPETPLAYAGGVVNDAVNVSVIAPFHDNVDPNTVPTVTASTGIDDNDVSITPSYDPNVPLSSTYTQIVKISFTLNGVAVDSDGLAIVNVTVDEEGLPDVNQNRLGDPERKTKIIVNSGG